MIALLSVVSEHLRVLADRLGPEQDAPLGYDGLARFQALQNSLTGG